MICPVYQFVKVFNQGILVGMRITEKMLFVNHQDAVQWFCGVNRANGCGDCDYHVIDFEYVEDKVIGGAEVC